jgi:hypothetical protein
MSGAALWILLTDSSSDIELPIIPFVYTYLAIFVYNQSIYK